MSNEMPEKILKPCPFCGNERVKPELGYDNGGLPGCGNCGAIISRYGGSYDLIEAWNQRTDTIPDVAELQRQNAALKEFVKTIIRQSWEHMELNGADIQETAVDHEILKPKVANESDVCEESDYSVGDDIFVFADWMLTDTAAMPAPSKAEVAREFYDHVLDAAAEICEATGDQQEYEGLEQSEVYPTALDIVLKEWEEADKCR